MPDDRVVPYLCVAGAADALDFYRRAFGAEERYRLPVPTGEIGAAEIRIGETVLRLADEHPPQGRRSPFAYGGSPVHLTLEVPDVDAVFARAVEAGATVEQAVSDADYGRSGTVVDPFGHHWRVITPNPDWPEQR